MTCLHRVVYRSGLAAPTRHALLAGRGLGLAEGVHGTEVQDAQDLASCEKETVRNI